MLFIRSLLLIVVSTFLVHSPARADDGACQTEMTQDDGQLGGGGISGVGGGGGLGFALRLYLNSIYQVNFPHLVILRRINPSDVTSAPTEVEACIYDKHFGDADTVHLVATLSCEGGTSITWPRQDSLRVHCEGAFGNDRLRFEATMLAGLYIGDLIRILPDGAQATEALFFGH